MRNRLLHVLNDGAGVRSLQHHDDAGDNVATPIARDGDLAEVGQSLRRLGDEEPLLPPILSDRPQRGGLAGGEAKAIQVVGDERAHGGIGEERANKGIGIRIYLY